MKRAILTIDEIKTKLHPIFKAAPIYRAILFGSYAKGNQTDNSDIDIIVDSRGQLLNIDFYGVLEDITTELGKRIDLMEVSELKESSAIKSIVEREGVVLYDCEG